MKGTKIEIIGRSFNRDRPVRNIECNEYIIHGDHIFPVPVKTILQPAGILPFRVCPFGHPDGYPVIELLHVWIRSQRSAKIELVFITDYCYFMD